MVLRPFLPVLTLNSKSSSTLFPFGFFLFGKCCCTNLEWSGATESGIGNGYFPVVLHWDGPKLAPFGTLVPGGHCYFTALLSSLFSAGAKKT